jgi:hypothetical protein
MAVVRYAVVAVLLAAVVAGCGSSSAPPQITIGAAKTYRLAGWQPAQFTARKPTVVSFRIDQPSGQALTDYRTGSGPHTGVHLIIVRDDLGAIVHEHPKPQADGTFKQEITLPTPGRYRVIVDAYPALSGPLRNFQLVRSITVPGKAVDEPLPPFQPVQVTRAYRFTLGGKPRLRAVQPNFLTLHITRPDGKPATFTPWFGALAHAIFFREGTLDYFHTHVCSAATSGCTSVFGGSKVVGRQTKPGVLRVGVLLPRSGTWRMFLQTKVDGRVLTAPFTLNVR